VPVETLEEAQARAARWEADYEGVRRSYAALSATLEEYRASINRTMVKLEAVRLAGLDAEAEASRLRDLLAKTYR
jgi:hypothetical protein